jgi:pyruvate dehydrogenase E1 component alpha subunit
MSAIVADAADRARRGDGPTLIEAVTYRHSGHSRADLAAYRPDGELDEWMKRDPILLLENAIKEFNPDGAQTIERIKENARIEVSEAKNRAVSWPEPAEVEEETIHGGTGSRRCLGSEQLWDTQRSAFWRMTGC